MSICKEGYLITLKNIHELHNFKNRLQDIEKTHIQNRFYQEVADFTIYIHDLHALYKMRNGNRDKICQNLIRELNQKDNSNTSMYDPVDYLIMHQIRKQYCTDNTLSRHSPKNRLILYPSCSNQYLMEIHGSLSYLFLEPDEPIKALMQEYQIKEFCYWDNTERPSHISEEEWTERAHAWKSVFAESSVPNIAGMNIEIYNQLLFLEDCEDDDLPAIIQKAKLPSKEQRAHKLAWTQTIWNLQEHTPDTQMAGILSDLQSDIEQQTRSINYNIYKSYFDDLMRNLPDEINLNYLRMCSLSDFIN